MCSTADYEVPLQGEACSKSQYCNNWIRMLGVRKVMHYMYRCLYKFYNICFAIVNHHTFVKRKMWKFPTSMYCCNTCTAAWMNPLQQNQWACLLHSTFYQIAVFVLWLEYTKWYWWLHFVHAHCTHVGCIAACRCARPYSWGSGTEEGPESDDWFMDEQPPTGGGNGL